MGSFSEKLFCLKRLPLYTFSSFKAHTKFPRRKNIRELPEHILWVIKKKSNRVLENCGVQSLSNSSGHHVVHITYSTLMFTQESIYKWFHWFIVRQWLSLPLKLFLTKFCCLILFNKCWTCITCQELCDPLGGQATLWSLLGNFPYNFRLNMGLLVV